MLKVCRKISTEEWGKVSETAHQIVFGEYRPMELDRISFALVVSTGKKDYAYATCREMDSKSLYWSYVGAFPGTKGSLHSFQAINCMLDWTLLRYQRLNFLIENDNAPALRFAAKLKFKIIGLRNFNGCILLEHMLQKGV